MSPLWIVKKTQSARDFFECLIFSADCVEIIHATNRDYEVQNDRVVKKIAFYSNIKFTLAGSVKDYTKVSSYYSDKERPAGALSVWAFFIYKNFFRKNFEVSTKPEFPFVLRSEREMFHSVPVGTEGGELLWSNLLPKSSRG